VNWGNSKSDFTTVNGSYHNHLNYPDAVAKAIDKKSAFAHMKAAGVSVPEVTVDAQVAKGWVEEGKEVVARKTLTGKGGAGILIVNKETAFPTCPLYTLYKRKKSEYRVHIFNGHVIDFQQKKRRKGQPADDKIRTAGNGWVFCREGITLPESAKAESIRAVSSLGLVFGGVDVIWNEHEQKAYVLEVNTAPGIEGTTVISYANAIREYVNAL
jgi:glutathione synthase/RimK-type ligase-like ATP-grasp enzyme